jgi:hypothetical protein
MLAPVSIFKNGLTIYLKAFLLSLIVASLVMPCYAGCFKDANGNTICCDENGNCTKVR